MDDFLSNKVLNNETAASASLSQPIVICIFYIKHKLTKSYKYIISSISSYGNLRSGVFYVKLSVHTITYFRIFFFYSTPAQTPTGIHNCIRDGVRVYDRVPNDDAIWRVFPDTYTNTVKITHRARNSSFIRSNDVIPRHTQ